VIRRVFAVVLVLAIAGVAIIGTRMFQFSGHSYKGTLPQLTPAEKAIEEQLKTHVNTLAVDIGVRDYHMPEKLEQTVAYIEKTLEADGYKPQEQIYEWEGRTYKNVEVEVKGISRPNEILVVGAHYDSVFECPAANDNGSGVAAGLILAKQFKDKKIDLTVRFVFFANEEYCFRTAGMGSYQYAQRCKTKKENIVGMISLETIGYYSDVPGSQEFPPGLGMFYPNTGNFIAFVGNLASADFIAQCLEGFRTTTHFPSEGLAAPPALDQAGWSDHRSFWDVGYPGLMVTDTAPFRYPHYHRPEDTPDKLNFEQTARVVAGLERMLAKLSLER
jgi:Peptidase family M28